MKLEPTLRWTARVWSLLSIAVLLAFAFGGHESLRPTAAQAIGVLFFPVGLIAGLVIAWWRERLGGLVSLSSIALLYLWIFSRQGRIPTGPYFLLLTAPAFLFIGIRSCASGRKAPRRYAAA